MYLNKIVFDHQIFTCQNVGGISRTFSEQIEALGSIRGQVEALAPLHRNLYLASIDQACVSGRYAPFDQPNLADMLEENRLLSNELLPKVPFVLHETYYTGKQPTSKHARIVITLHDLVHELMPEQSHPDDRTLVHKRAAVERADHVICVSQNTLNDAVEHFGLAPDKASIIHHGVHAKWFDFPSHVDEERVRQGSSESKPFILVVGHRGGYKFFSGLLKAVGMSPRIARDFSIVCFGGGALTAEELEQAQSCGMEGNIRVHTGDDQDLARLYATAIALVYPSLYEGFGLPVLEAMAVGCPVICSDAASLPEVAGSAAVSFLSGNVEALAEALEKVLYSDEMQTELVEKGKTRAVQFTWEKNVKQLVDVYSGLL